MIDITLRIDSDNLIRLVTKGDDSVGKVWLEEIERGIYRLAAQRRAGFPEDLFRDGWVDDGQRPTPPGVGEGHAETR